MQADVAPRPPKDAASPEAPRPKKKVVQAAQSPKTEKASNGAASDSPKTTVKAKEASKAASESPKTPKEAPRDAPPVKPKARPPRKATMEDLIDKDNDPRTQIGKTVATLSQMASVGDGPLAGKLAGTKLSKKQQEEVVRRTQEVMDNSDDALVCVGHLRKIIELATKHAKAGGYDPKPVRQYFIAIVKLTGPGSAKALAQGGRGTDAKVRQAGEHRKALKDMYAAYRAQINEGDLSWLDCGSEKEPTGNKPVVLTHNAKQERLPLSDLYHFLSDSDDTKLLEDLVHLQHHLWSIFAKVGETEGERKACAVHADDCKTAPAPEAQLRGLASDLRDAVNSTPGALDKDGEPADTKKIITAVVDGLMNSGSITGVLDQLKESAVDGTFDIHRIAAEVQDGAEEARLREEAEAEEDDEDEDERTPDAKETKE